MQGQRKKDENKKTDKNNKLKYIRAAVEDKNSPFVYTTPESRTQ